METTGAIDAEAQLTNMTSNGFTLNWANAPASADRVYYLALKGGNYDVGFFQKTTSEAPVTQPITDISFKPTGLILTSVNNLASSTAQSNNRLSFGAATANASGAVWSGDTDNAANAITALSSVTAKMIRMATEAATGSSSTINAEASLQSFDSVGFTLNWTTNDSAPNEVIFVVLG